MSRKQFSIGKQLMLATALAFGASGLALADDSSMSPYIGDSWIYFNGGQDLGRVNQVAAPRSQTLTAALGSLPGAAGMTPPDRTTQAAREAFVRANSAVKPGAQAVPNNPEFGRLGTP